MYAKSINYTLILDMSEILDSIYIWVLLENSGSDLLIAFAKYMLYSHCTEKLIKIFLYLCILFVQKTVQLILEKPGMVGRRKLPNPSLNRIFNALSISVQYTLSFQWTNFGRKCLLFAFFISNTFFNPASMFPNLFMNWALNVV